MSYISIEVRVKEVSFPSDPTEIPHARTESCASFSTSQPQRVYACLQDRAPPRRKIYILITSSSRTVLVACHEHRRRPHLL